MKQIDLFDFDEFYESVIKKIGNRVPVRPKKEGIERDYKRGLDSETVANFFVQQYKY